MSMTSRIYDSARQRDGEEPFERPGTIQRRGLVEVIGDAPQGGKKDHHVEAGILPARDDHD